MAVLQNIRVKFGVVISAIIALALLSFIIDPGTLESAVNSMSSKYDVGKIAGKSVSYTDFLEDVDKYTTVNEIITGSSVQNEQTQQSIRNAAWQSLIDKYMFVKNAKAAGLTVGDEELLDLTTGDRISAVIAQNPAFVDANGNFSPEALVDFVQNIDSDPSGRLRIFWNYLQNTVYTQAYYAKYGALFTQSSYLNSLMTGADIAENNTTSDVEYVTVFHPFTKDSTITVSSSEIKNYYNSHKDFYKQTASRDAEYVVFEVIPSADDIAAAGDALAKAYEEFATTSNLKSYLSRNSERSYSEYWYKDGELNTISKDINDFVFSNNSGVSPVFQSGNTFYAARIMNSAQVSDSVYVKHILLQGDSAAEADNILAQAKKGNFAQLVATYSADQGSMADGELGNIGWMTQTYMIPGLESVMTATVGEPYIVKSQYGTHIVVVTKKTRPVAKKQVAILEKSAIASKETYNTYYSQANKFATIANGTYAGYKAAVDTMGVYSHPMNRMTEATSSFGSIESAKEVTRWIFDAKKGKASNIITVANKYFFVAVVKEINKEGYVDIKVAAPSIENHLYSQKLSAKRLAEVSSEIAGMNDLEQIADKYNTSVMTREGLAFTSRSGASVDPALIGAASKAEVGQIGTVAGSAAVYVYRVAARETGAFYTADDAKTTNLSKAQYSSQMIIPAMMEEADVKDNRARFF